MAHEAVDPGLVGKVEGCVLPAIAGMTARTTWPVAENTDAEIVDGYSSLAQIHPLVLTQGEWRGTFPQPVSGVEHLLAFSRVATEALLCHLEGVGFSGKFDKVGMVPDPPFVATARAPYGAPMKLLVTARALAVDSPFESYTLRCYGVEGMLMAGRTAHGLRDIIGLWPIMMTNGTII